MPADPIRETTPDHFADPGKMVHETTAFATADRRDMLCRAWNHPPRSCSACGTRQVQLLDHTETPAVWRCRECRNVFAWEPAA